MYNKVHSQQNPVNRRTMKLALLRLFSVGGLLAALAVNGGSIDSRTGASNLPVPDPRGTVSSEPTLQSSPPVPVAPRLPSAPVFEVLELSAVPSGRYRVNLRVDGRECRMDVEVRAGDVRCQKHDWDKLAGLGGRFQAIGNGVFLVYLSGPNHRATQFWVFHPDGTASVKEVPDRGEQQLAVPVKGETLDLPESAAAAAAR